MAVSLIENPRQSINGYTSFSASTEQLLYKFNEDDLAGKEAYVLECLINELGITLYVLPDSAGNMSIDVGHTIQRSTEEKAIAITIDYTPTWRGGSGATQTTLVVLAVRSKRQIMSTNGSNLYEYIAKPTYLGKFMTQFSEPKFWEGWERYAYFISQDYSLVDFTFTPLDINKQALTPTAADTSLDSTPDVFIMSLTYPAVANAEYMSIQGSDATDGILTESLIYKLEQECQNPLMVEWLNSEGGYSQYLFQIEQSVTNVADEGIKYNIHVQGSIENARGNKGRYSNKDIQFIALKAANLTQNELQALHDIKRSSEVKIWLTKDSLQWVNVRVNAGFEDSFTTGKRSYEFFLNLEMPDNFDLFKAIQY